MAEQATKLNNVKKATKKADPYRQVKADIASFILKLDDMDAKLVEVDTIVGDVLENMDTLEARVGKVEARLGIG